MKLIELATIAGITTLLVLFSSSLAYAAKYTIGSEEIVLRNSLMEGEADTYELVIEPAVIAFSYYLRTNESSICYLNLYDSSGKEVYKEDFGAGLFSSQFLGRSETEIVNLSNTKGPEYTFDVRATSDQTVYGIIKYCIYELHLKGMTSNINALTREEILSEQLKKKNDELVIKETEIANLQKTVNDQTTKISYLNEQVAIFQSSNQSIKEKLSLWKVHAILAYFLLIMILAFIGYRYFKKMIPIKK